MAKESPRRESSEEFLLESPLHYRDDDPKEPYKLFLSSPSSNNTRKKLVIVFALVAAIPLLALVFFSRPSLTQLVLDAPVALDLDLESYVVGPPTQSFRGQ
jgi:hypothetical protein